MLRLEGGIVATQVEKNQTLEQYLNSEFGSNLIHQHVYHKRAVFKLRNVRGGF